MEYNQECKVKSFFSSLIEMFTWMVIELAIIGAIVILPYYLSKWFGSTSISESPPTPMTIQEVANNLNQQMSELTSFLMYTTPALIVTVALIVFISNKKKEPKWQQ